MMRAIVIAKQRVAYHLVDMVPMNVTTLCQILLQTAMLRKTVLVILTRIQIRKKMFKTKIVRQKNLEKTKLTTIQI